MLNDHQDPMYIDKWKHIEESKTEFRKDIDQIQSIMKVKISI